MSNGFPSVDTSSTEVKERSISTRYVLGSHPDGGEALLKVTTMHSPSRKVYATTIGNTRREAVEGGSVETWMPLDDARVVTVPAGGRFSRKALVRAHDEAQNALRKTDNPALTRYFDGSPVPG